jgi:hypothetical protein
MGSKSDDKSYVTGMTEAEGRSAMESGGGVIAVGGGGAGGGDGSSNVARWACKYESSACKFTTCLNNLSQKKRRKKHKQIN